MSGPFHDIANNGGVWSRGDWAPRHIPLAEPGPGCESPATFSKPWPTGSQMERITFTLDRDFVELNQLLKLTGLCDSGGAGKQLVASGAVRVDGAIELRKTCKIHAGQRVSLGDVEIEVVPLG